MNTVYLLLGSNKGNIKDNLEKSIQCIGLKVGNIKKKSSLYSTKAWGNINQPDFMNQAIMLETKMSAEELLKNILLIEEKLGRKRTEEKWMERIIDIDILFFNNEVINKSNLVIPHPLIGERKFVLVPLMEIAKNFVHPVFNKTIEKLSGECEDKLEVKRTDD